MKSDQTHRIQSQHKYENLHKVTLLSKYLMMVLFVLLPFIGAWVGLTIAPIKISTIKQDTILDKNENYHKFEDKKGIVPKPKIVIDSELVNHVKKEKCPLDQSGKYILISDPSSSIAISSEIVLDESGLSKIYRREHFSFICGIEYSPTNRRVAWQYSIGDYSGVIEGILNAPENVGPKFSEIVGSLHNIQYTSSKKIAEKEIQRCLGTSTADIQVKLIGGPTPFPNSTDKNKVNYDNKNGGLFLIANVSPITDLIDSSISHYKTAYLNLETMKCTVMEHTVVID